MPRRPEPDDYYQPKWIAAGASTALHESILFRAYRVPARIGACVCGGAVVAYEDVAGAVREHNATPEHRAWRWWANG